MVISGGQAFCYRRQGGDAQLFRDTEKEGRKYVWGNENQLIPGHMSSLCCCCHPASYIFCCIAPCIHKEVLHLDTLTRLLWGRWADEHAGSYGFRCVTTSAVLAPSWAPGSCVLATHLQWALRCQQWLPGYAQHFSEWQKSGRNCFNSL